MISKGEATVAPPCRVQEFILASKTVHVRAHDRLIHTRHYKFICAQCNHGVERETYAVNCPKYCINCRPPKPPQLSRARRNKIAEMVIKNLNKDEPSRDE